MTTEVHEIIVGGANVAERPSTKCIMWNLCWFRGLMYTYLDDRRRSGIRVGPHELQQLSCGAFDHVCWVVQLVPERLAEAPTANVYREVATISTAVVVRQLTMTTSFSRRISHGSGSSKRQARDRGTPLNQNPASVHVDLPPPSPRLCL